MSSSIRLRIQKLQELLIKMSMDALLVEDTINLYYLTGIELSAGQLIVKQKETTLWVDGRYYEQCKQRSPIPVNLLDFANEKSPPWLDTAIRSLAVSNEMSYRRYQSLQTNMQNVTLVPIDDPVQRLRMVKDSVETAVMQEAATLGTKGYEYVLTLLKEGISEEEIAIELEIFWRRHGGKKVAFDPIIAFGANSALPHHRAGATRLKKGDTVLIDIGVNYRHYHSDMTRVVFFGEPSPEVKRIYTIVEQAQKAALTICRPGVPVGELDQAARGLITASGYGKQFSHGLGHGVGLEIHEQPFLRNTASFKEIRLEAGMVITIEPGIYLPGVGGVRLEDMILITPDGYHNLTTHREKK